MFDLIYDFVTNLTNDPIVIGSTGVFVGLLLSFIFGSLRSKYRNRFVLPKLKIAEDARRKAKLDEQIKELIGPLRDAITKIENNYKVLDNK